MDAQFSMVDDRSPQKRSDPPQSIERGQNVDHLRSGAAKDDDFSDAVGTMYDDEHFKQDTDTIAQNLSDDNSIDNEMAAILGIRRKMVI
jgi:hypothetical protein